MTKAFMSQTSQKTLLLIIIQMAAVSGTSYTGFSSHLAYLHLQEKIINFLSTEFKLSTFSDVSRKPYQ
jgi:hypothetical protein